MKVRKALVTLAIGKKYEERFDLVCMPSWNDYCKVHDFDLVVVRQPFDDSVRAQERSASWQKLLILSQDWSKKYEQIVWVDSDIMMNSKAAPNVAQGVPVEKVGAIDLFTQFPPSIQTLARTRLYKHWKEHGLSYLENQTPASYYGVRNLPGEDLDAVVQAGVLVCSPKYHRQIFEHVYHTYEDKPGAAALNYEMPALSFEIMRNKLEYWISPQFNVSVSMFAAAFYPFIFHEKKSRHFIQRAVKAVARKSGYDIHRKLRMAALSNIYELSFFTHFAGCAGLMPQLHHYLSKRTN